MKKLLFLTAIAVLTFNSSNAQEEVVVLVDERFIYTVGYSTMAITFNSETILRLFLHTYT